MIIDTESPEGRALVVLASFGRAILDRIQSGSCDPIVGEAYTAVEFGLFEPYDGWEEGQTFDETILAKLPEGL